MTNRPIDVLGFGVAAVDEFIELDHFPPADCKEDLRAHSTQCGGICVNALAAASRLGCSCHFAGSLGDNVLSEIVRGGLRAEGISFEDLNDRPAERRAALADAGPSHAFILVDRSAGTRAILMDKARVIDLMPEDLPEGLITRARALYIDAWHLDAGRHAVDIARRHGVLTFADFEEHDLERVTALARDIDHLILPFGFAQRMTGETEPEAVLLALEPARRAATAITLGAEGSLYATGDEPTPHRQLAYPATHVADTTGCGDAFHGAYIAAILDGATVPAAMNFASAAATLNTRTVGAIAGLPTRAEVTALLKTSP